MTPATPGAVAIWSSAPVMRCRTAGSVTFAPPVVCQTTWSLSPAEAGSACLSRSIAWLDSDAGIDIVSLYLVPAEPVRAPRPMISASQTTTVTRRCLWHQRAMTDIRVPRPSSSMDRVSIRCRGAGVRGVWQAQTLALLRS